MFNRKTDELTTKIELLEKKIQQLEADKSQLYTENQQLKDKINEAGLRQAYASQSGAGMLGGLVRTWSKRN